MVDYKNMFNLEGKRAVVIGGGGGIGGAIAEGYAAVGVKVAIVGRSLAKLEKKAAEIKERIAKVARVKLDDSDQSPGWKFAEYEMKGVPLRLEIGPRDIEQNQCVIVRRDTREKIVVSLDELEEKIPELLTAVRDGIYQKALANREKKTYACKTMDEIITALDQNGDGFIKAMWCGEEACEDTVKETTGVGSRCLPLEQEIIGDTCVCCGKPAHQLVYWGKAY